MDQQTKELFIFVLERLQVLEKYADEDAILLDQLNRAVQGSPIGAPVDQHLRAAIAMIAKRHAASRSQSLDELIQRLKRS